MIVLTANGLADGSPEGTLQLINRAAEESVFVGSEQFLLPELIWVENVLEFGGKYALH